MLVCPLKAEAYCSEPRVPSIYETKPEAPREPFCINKLSNTHTCSDWEIDSYNRDVRQDNSDLQSYDRAVDQYVRELDMYLSQARQYAECEVSRL